MNLIWWLEGQPKKDQDTGIPFGLYPMLVFSHLIDTLFHRFRPYSLDVPKTIVVNDSGDFGLPTDVVIRRKPNAGRIE